MVSQQKNVLLARLLCKHCQVVLALGQFSALRNCRRHVQFIVADSDVLIEVYHEVQVTVQLQRVTVDA